jgi:ribonuclease G
MRRINHFTGPGLLFEKYQVQRQINEAFFRQVWMPCGGYIVIDQTEALVSIDVNTGRNKGATAGTGQERVILQTNMEAAAEVARQLRLRNMGGLIVVDFIDMKHRRDQQAVYKLMIDHLKRDKAKTQILPISQFGLMEMTRQRLHESLADAMYEECPHCKGHGQIKTPLTMSVELQRHLGSVLTRLPENDRDVLIVISPDVMNILRSHDGILDELQRKYSARLTFRTDPSYRREQYMLANAKTGEDLKM